MSVQPRPIVRVVAAVAAVGVVVGAPTLFVRAVGVPVPTREQWRSVWVDHQMDSGFVIRAGLMLVSVLWLWFVVTAVAELVHVVGRGVSGRAVVHADPTDGSAGGASHWVRRCVRFIAVSSAVTAGSVAIVASGAGHRTHHSAVSAPPVAVPVAPSLDGSRSSSLLMAELAGLSLLSAGVVLSVQRVRRQRLRLAPRGARIASRSVDEVRFETMVSATDPVERIARLDHAMRFARAQLEGTCACVVGARLCADGTIRLRTSQLVEPFDPRWLLDAEECEWVLPPSAAAAPSGGVDRSRAGSSALMVPVGVDQEGRECFVDVGGTGALVIESPAAARILRAIAASLSLSPFMDGGAVIAVGLGEVPVGDRPVVHVDSFAAAVARVGEVGDQPVVVVSAMDTGMADDGVAAGLLPVAGARRVPFGVVAAGGSSTYRLVSTGEQHVVQPWGWVVAPPEVGTELVGAVQATLDAAELPFERVAPTVAFAHLDVTTKFIEPEWQLLVRTLGQVEVVSVDGLSVPFDRSKSLELVVWLALHRERPTRSKARAALWDTAVTAATFSNVVSEARRAMARAMPPPPECEWIARTLTEELSMHALVLTDADLLAARVDAARRLPSFEAIDVLRPGLELVTGLPFESGSYTWPDAEGHTSALVLLATDAATDLASHYLALGDIDGVFWATGQGLKVLSGHEELIAMRMRAHAARGDRSGVRHEWESYERALAADPWSAADPSPKLVALRAELLRSETTPSSRRVLSA